MYFLGFDIGSSSIKAALVDGHNNTPVGVAHYPDTEMGMISHQAGWAEQDPEMWWEYVCKATQKLLKQTNIKGEDVHAIGISYQMHGLVTVDNNMKPLRPSIIWCDSRAVQIGEDAFVGIGEQKCQKHLLNSPANFTAAKLKWVKDNEPELYKQVYKAMLPGDFVVLRMTGEATTTISGLSEGIFWDFENNEVAKFLMEYMGFDRSIVPDIVPTFGMQGKLTAAAAAQLGLRAGTMVGYRAGDQPNNALSLGVLAPGEIAATGGTSGVVYGVKDQPVFDMHGRINSFAHVNHSTADPRIGVLLCINGAGIQYRYIKQLMAGNAGYDDMEKEMQNVPIGADGLSIIPFGNGAERMLGNRDIGTQMLHVQLNRHQKAHYYRAALEGVAYAFIYGIEVLKELGLDISKMRVGNDNLFRSATFSNAIATLANAPIELVETTGAIGAARGAGFAFGHFKSLKEAVSGDKVVKTYNPTSEDYKSYKAAYDNWAKDLSRLLNN